MDFANLIPVPTYGIDALSQPYVTSTDSLPRCDFINETPQISYQALKIARAKTGANEIRLMQKLVDGKPSGFSLKFAELSPYSVRQQDLVSESDAEPMTKSQALAAFDVAVSEKYPAVRLRNRSLLAIHETLL